MALSIAWILCIIDSVALSIAWILCIIDRVTLSIDLHMHYAENWLTNQAIIHLLLLLLLPITALDNTTIYSTVSDIVIQLLSWNNNRHGTCDSQQYYFASLGPALFSGLKVQPQVKWPMLYDLPHACGFIPSLLETTNFYEVRLRWVIF